MEKLSTAMEASVTDYRRTAVASPHHDSGTRSSMADNASRTDHNHLPIVACTHTKIFQRSTVSNPKYCFFLFYNSKFQLLFFTILTLDYPVSLVASVGCCSSIPRSGSVIGFFHYEISE